jgi:hypothetical protein
MTLNPPSSRHVVQKRDWPMFWYGAAVSLAVTVLGGILVVLLT